MYGGSEAAAAGLHLSMGSLLEEQQRAAPQMVSNLPNATPTSSFLFGMRVHEYCLRRLLQKESSAGIQRDRN